MKKLLSRAASLFLSGLLAAQAPAASTLPHLLSPQAISLSSDLTFRVQQEAVVEPLIHWLGSFSSRKAFAWEWIAHPAGVPSGYFAVPTPGSSESGDPTARPKKDDPLVAEVTRQLFNRHDGIEFISVVATLQRLGILEHLRRQRVLTSQDLMQQLHQWQDNANSGFWEAAMQGLAEQGWIVREGSVAGQMTFRLTDLGETATRNDVVNAYVMADRLIRTDFASVEQLDHFLIKSSPRAPPEGPLTFPEAVVLSAQEWNLPQETAENREIRQRTLKHLDGLLVGMAGFTLVDRGLIALKKDEQGETIGARFIEDRLTFNEARERLLQSIKGRASWLKAVGQRMMGKPFVEDAYLRSALSLLVQQKWALYSEGYYEMTAKGNLAARNVLASGVPISYLPTLSRMDELLVGDPSKVFRYEKGQEMWVARGINVRGSGAAHKKLFRKILPLIEEIFNRPLEEQPLFICDMGSGDGTYLATVYEHILKHTKRGEAIRSGAHPLLMIGADYSEVSRRETKKTLSAARFKLDDGKTYAIPHEVIYGDINRPDDLERAIRELTGLDPRWGLHTSTFLIHNRPFIVPHARPSSSDDRGAYTSHELFYPGYAIPSAALDQNLIEFFQRWEPLIERFGMLTIELHGMPDDLSVKYLDQISNTSYVVTHSLTGQYIIPLPHFIALAKQAGLEVARATPMPRDYGDGHAPNSILFLKAKPEMAADEGENFLLPRQNAAAREPPISGPWRLRSMVMSAFPLWQPQLAGMPAGMFMAAMSEASNGRGGLSLYGISADDSPEPEDPLSLEKPSFFSHAARWLLPTAGVVLGSAAYLVARLGERPRTIVDDQAHLRELQRTGKILKNVYMGGRRVDIEPGRWWHDRGVADVLLATEYRNRKNLSAAEKYLLQSRVAPGLDITKDNLTIRASDAYVRETRRQLENNPFSLVAIDQGQIVAVVFCALVAADSANDLPSTWEKMSAQYIKDIHKTRTTIVDFWFTGDHPEMRMGIIALSHLLKEELRNKPEWGIQVRHLYPFSNPRAKWMYPELHIADYLLKVIQYAESGKGNGAIADPAILFHLGNGARIVRIIEDAFPQIEYQGQPSGLHHDEKAIGGGFSVVLEYPESLEAAKTSPDHLIASREFVLKWKEKRDRAARISHESVPASVPLTQAMQAAA